MEKIIRKATEDDLDAIVALGMQMDLDTNLCDVRNMAYTLCQKDMLYLILDAGKPIGYFGYMLTRQWWNAARTQMIVVSLYIEPDHRTLRRVGDVLRTIEGLGMSYDITEIVFGLGAVPQGSREADLMVKLFKRYGYHLGEPVLRKEL